MRRRVIPLVLVVLLAVAGVGVAVGTDSSPNLGLDLQGGISVVLEPTEEEQAAAADGDTELDDRLDEAVSIIRERVDGLGVAEPEISRQGDAIVVQLPGVEDRERVLELVGSTAELRFRPVLSVVPAEEFEAAQEASEGEASEGDDAEDEAEAEGDGAEASEGGDADGEAADESSEDGDDSAEADADESSEEAEGDESAEADADESSEEAEGDESAEAEEPADLTRLTPLEEDDPEEVVVLEDKDGEMVYTLGPMLASGQIVRTAEATTDQVGAWFVGLSLRSGEDGNDLFNEAAAICYGRQPEVCPTGSLAIVLDGLVQSAPTIEQPSFDGSAQITGQFDKQEAQDLALVLRYGALPVELERQSFETVSASLGEDSLWAGIVAGVFGLLLVAAYMMIYYRVLGAVVISGMVTWAGLMYAVVSWLGVTQGLALTLAGVTGVIISVGVIVDSYVVYFERLKDEVKLGRSVRASADKAFKAAFRTILAANVATLIGAGILWWWTVGAVRGFAFFLGLANLLGLLVTVTFTRGIVNLLVRNRFLVEARGIGVRSALAARSGTDLETKGVGPTPKAEPAGGTS